MMEQFEPKVANKYRMARLVPGRPWLQSISVFDANVCCSEEIVSPHFTPLSGRRAPPLLATPPCRARTAWPSASCAHYRAALHPSAPPCACTAPKQQQQAVVAGWVTLQHAQHANVVSKHSDKTLATYVRNS